MKAISKVLLGMQLIGILCMNLLQAQGAETSPLAFKASNVLQRMPNKEVQYVAQGRDGDLWICTRNGLFQYDGYSLVCYKSDGQHPELLTSNNILCAKEDNRHRLWIGTYNGLNILDLTTHAIRKVDHPAMNQNVVSDILVTKDNRILFATDWGLYEYREETDNFTNYTPENTQGVLPKTPVKTLMEDNRGDLWIGTWSEGLFRYEQDSDKFFRYPRLNEQNSAHKLFQDSKNRIWVGTWRSGLLLLKNAYDVKKVNWVSFRTDKRRASSISDDIIYALTEDTNTGDIWVGTRRGLSLLPPAAHYTGQEAFRNYYPDESNPSSISSDEVTSLLCDRQGFIWVGMIGGGVDMVDVRRVDFNGNSLLSVNDHLHTSSVRSMLMDDENQLWLGIGSYGFGMYNRQDDTYIHYSQIPEFASHPSSTTTVTSIMQHSQDKHIWITAYDDGVYEIDKQAPVGRRVRHYFSADVPWLAGNCVYQAFEDSDGNLWFATRNGISMRRADGTAARFDTLSVENIRMRNLVTVCITEDQEGNIWGGSSTHGIFRLKKTSEKGDTYKVQTYSPRNGKLLSAEVNCLYCDEFGRVWTGTSSAGLNLYDPKTDAFQPVHHDWKLPGGAVMSIRSDRDSNLWMGTDVGLVKVILSNPDRQVSYLLYTVDNGLQDNSFNRGAVTVAADGEMFFGGHRGYNNFYPERVRGYDFSPTPLITDIQVFNRSWDDLPMELREKISPLAPRFARKIVLDHRHNNFSIEFSAMDYTNPALNEYAYRLDGFDEDWMYTNATKRYAAYNNLQSGTYTFRLKASSTNGTWGQEMPPMEVVVLPAPWQTWWAYTLYILAACALLIFLLRLTRNRIRLRNMLHIREVEKAKVEEMNHVKLQFFTNITHELLTPLTILLALVDELKRMAPGYKDQYRLMYININRLIRLLQQILEFRKAESGNLKLRVSQADLSQFVRRSVESFSPLMRRKDIRFTCVCQPETLPAYFDPDKMDKILYNLLSNASKYNKEGDEVQVELQALENGNARLSVRDNGPGISKSAQKDLFKRFYEGDYRKFGTIGTGIGLSLVRDLVTLHHGTIEVESEEGQGATFIVIFPIVREKYEEKEIDDSPIPANEILQPIEQPEGEENVLKPDSEKEHTLLLVDDNEELLLLMCNVLQVDYKVLMSHNGKEALDVLKQQSADVVVSDVIMPEMDGLTLCRTLKEEVEGDIPVILLTAKNSEEDRIEAYEAGADAYIAKPFNIGVLQARIANLLQQHKRIANHELKFKVKDYNYTGDDKEFLQACIDCVTKHVSEIDFTQAQFAEEMNISKSTLFRRLKQLTGEGGASFIANVRMKVACRILDERYFVPVAELADMVGYNDSHYFTVKFKKVVGCTPSEYGKRKREQAAAQFNPGSPANGTTPEKAAGPLDPE